MDWGNLELRAGGGPATPITGGPMIATGPGMGSGGSGNNGQGAVNISGIGQYPQASAADLVTPVSVVGADPAIITDDTIGEPTWIELYGNTAAVSIIALVVLVAVGYMFMK